MTLLGELTQETLEKAYPLDHLQAHKLGPKYKKMIKGKRLTVLGNYNRFLV